MTSDRNDKKSNKPAIAIVGFGEAGQAFGKGLHGHASSVTTFDILFEDKSKSEPLLNAANEGGVFAVMTLSEAVAKADIIFSLVTAGSARTVAKIVSALIHSNQIFFDLNSISPSEKVAGAALINEANARYVEGAIMAPVAPAGYQTQILAAGPMAGDLVEILAPLGMKIEVAGPEYGAASAIKLCRSVVVKGFEAIVVEAVIAARKYGADQVVLESLAKTYPGIDWPEQTAYVFNRVMQHGKRRSEEMWEASTAMRDIGLEPLMSDAIAKRQAWAAETIADSDIDMTGDYPTLADAMIKAMEKQS